MERCHDVITIALISYGQTEKILEPSVLLLKRKEDDNYWPGKWFLIAEHRKKGETDYETIKRGMWEETKTKPLWKIKGPIIGTTNKNKEKFLIKGYIIIPNTLEITLNREHDKAIWHPINKPIEKNSLIKLKDISNILYQSLWALGINTPQSLYRKIVYDCRR